MMNAVRNVSMLVCAVAIGCSSAASLRSSEDENGPTTAGSASETPTTPAPQPTFPDASIIPPNDGAARPLVVVNASRRVPAFRVCRDEASTPVSDSEQRPFPIARMPGSNLSGVDVNGAVRLDPRAPEVADLAAATSAVLLFVDADTKANTRLSEGTCRDLACVGGTSCLGSTKLRHAPLRDGAGMAAMGFTGGHVLVLRDDPASADGVFFEVRAMPATGTTGQTQFVYTNLSDSTETLRLTEGASSRNLTPGAAFSVDPTALDGVLRVGNLSVSLTDLHSVSEPTTDITSFYGTSAPLGLFLLGLSAPAAADQAYALKLVAVPYAIREADRDSGVDAR